MKDDAKSIQAEVRKLEREHGERAARKKAERKSVEKPATDDDGVSRIANHLNLHCALQQDPLTANLVAFDEFAFSVVLQRPIPRPNGSTLSDDTPRPWQDADDAALCEHFNRRGFRRVAKTTVRDVVELEARDNAFHPVRDFLESLTWDGTPRRSRWLLDHCKAVAASDDQARYVEAVGRAWLISAVARVMQPGCKVDTMPVLEGAQGTLKSRMLRMLAVRDEWFSDSLPHDLSSKDARHGLRGKWIVEFPEIAQFRGVSNVETLKSYLSCQIDSYRPPFGRTDVHNKRQCVFCGTTNEDQYLHDTTGNRRFWPVKVTSIDLDALRADRDQLWAESLIAYRAGEQWWLGTDIESITAAEQDARVEVDPWHDRIADFVDRSTATIITNADVMDALGLGPDRRNRDAENRIGKVLRLLGLVRKKRRIEPIKRPKWSWKMPGENLFPPADE